MVQELRKKYPLGSLLKICGLSRSSYHHYLKKSYYFVGKYVAEKELIFKIHTKDRSLGYRRITLAMREFGVFINHKTVLKLMRELNIQGKSCKIKRSIRIGVNGESSENIIAGDFEAERPCEKLTTDVTEFSIPSGKVFLSPVLDMFNREIIAYNISVSANFAQTKNMMGDLLKVLPKKATAILHSDQGWQYRMREYRDILAENGITQSMSRKGNCLDNSVIESFFGRLKVEMFYGEKFDSLDELILAIEKYIAYYNNNRISLKLKMSPVKYRHQFYCKN
ncbi:MAG: IS3 family transposase [Lentisphaeria bacterium]